MYRKILSGVILSAAMLLTACQNSVNDGAEITEATSGTTAAVTTTTTAAVTEPVPQRSYAAYELTTAEKSEIQDFLTEFKRFSHDYLDCKIYRAYPGDGGEPATLDVNDVIRHREAGDEDFSDYCRAVGGDYSTYSELMAAIDRFCSERVIAECNLKHGEPAYRTNYMQGENDGLYVWRDANSGGSVMGFDTAYITAAEISEDGAYIRLIMTAWGDGEFWETPDGKDMEQQFEIVLKREGDALRLEECGLEEMSFLTWLYLSEYDRF